MTNSTKAQRVGVTTLSPITLAALTLLLAVAGSARAQDWGFDPIIKVAGEYDDNAELNIRTDQETTLRGYLLEIGADIDYASARTTFALSPKVIWRK